MQNEHSPALELKNVTTTYGSSRGIENVSLTVQRGEVFGFLGPNGAGKSTTINTILDLLRPKKGTINVFGLDHRKNAKAVHAHLGYLSGDMETDPSLTGGQYLEFAANLHGGVDKAVVASLVARLKCDTTKRIKHLSRGNRQKIGLIAALMHDPDLLILDEPTSGLDPLIQAEFNAIIREHAERGKTTFISSHVLSEVQAICDRVGFIKGGKLIRVSPLDELIGEATKQVTVTFKKPVQKATIAKLKGTHMVNVDGAKARFHFKGDDNELVKLLALHPVQDVQISEPDLSDLFMDYYQEKTRV